MDNNLTWQPRLVSQRRDRQLFIGHAGAVVWFTGLSGSGKSTIATRVERALYERWSFYTYLLDGDNLRHGLNADLGFSVEDRKENIRRASEVALLMADAGIVVFCAFISPMLEDREAVRARCYELSVPFFEVYCAASLDVCEQRDPKGLYKKARSGVIKDFTGIDSPYQPPVSPELTLNTGNPAELESLVETTTNFLYSKL